MARDPQADVLNLASTDLRRISLLAGFSLLLFLITASTYGSLGVVLPAMIGELGWSFEQAFLGFSVLGLFTGASSWLPAILIRKIGVRGTLLLGSAVLGAGLLGLAGSESIVRYYVGAALCGIGFQMAALIPGTHVLSALYRKRALPFGIYFTFGSLGGVAGPWMALAIMGGTDNGVGNVTPAAEYNFYVDPEAAKIVINAGFKLSIVTWTETLRDGLLDLDQLGQLEALGSPRARFFNDVNRASLAFAQETEGLNGSLHPDALTCALALDEDLILESEQAVVDVEILGELTRGYLSVSHNILPDIELADPSLKRRTPNARVIKKIDQTGFFAAMRQALL